MRAVMPISVLTLLFLSTGCADEPDLAAGPEVARIQAHLGEVFAELRTSIPRGLTKSQAAAREQTIRWLEEYRAAGAFPHNHVRSGERIPVFVDPHGTPCAVGYLMLRSGEDALVEQIVRNANLARIPELSGDERLTRWLDRRGLTLSEAARIQPEYQPRDPDAGDPSGYAGETIALSIVSAAVTAFSELTEPDPTGFDWPASLSVATSVSHGTLLTIALVDEDTPSWQIAVNGIGALVSGIVAGHRFSRRGEAKGDGNGDGVAMLPLVGGSRAGVSVGVTLQH